MLPGQPLDANEHEQHTMECKVVNAEEPCTELHEAVDAVDMCGQQGPVTSSERDSQGMSVSVSAGNLQHSVVSSKAKLPPSQQSLPHVSNPTKLQPSCFSAIH